MRSDIMCATLVPLQKSQSKSAPQKLQELTLWVELTPKLAYLKFLS